MRVQWIVKPQPIILATFLIVSIGCNKDPAANGPAKSTDGVDPEALSSQVVSPSEDAPLAPALNTGRNRGQTIPPLPSSDSTGPNGPSTAGQAGGEMRGMDLVPSGLQLPAQSGSASIVAFLADADREIQRLATTGVAPNQQQALVDEIKRVAKLKQAAAERLLDSAELDSKLAEIAVSAKMQAFSHQAAFGDLVAAEALEKYANEMVNSTSAEISRDCRTILIGFALERLQGGVTTEPDEVLRLISDLAGAPERLNGASAKVMQRAMVILNQYGYHQAAEEVRATIEQAFANTNDPKLATLAADILAAARFNELETLRTKIYKESSLDLDRWSEAATRIAADHPDLMTVQYLATVALQLEAVGQTQVANAIYIALRDAFVQTNDAKAADELLSKLAAEAINGFVTRKDIIGKPFQITAEQALSGKTIQPAQFDGKIVLMPFWAVEQFDSLAPLGGLESIVAANPDKVCLLGVNMDSTLAGKQQAEKISAFEMPWPSLPALKQPSQDQPSPDQASAQNPFTSTLAKNFGVVSLPVVVVLDSQHNVAAVALSPDAVESTVRSLIE